MKQQTNSTKKTGINKWDQYEELKKWVIINAKDSVEYESLMKLVKERLYL